MGATYIITDLELRARFKFAALDAEIQKTKLSCISDLVRYKGVWQAGYNSCTYYEPRKPNRDIEEILKIVENLSPEVRSQWDRCLSRRFDLGFRGLEEPFHSTWQIKPALLQRIVALNVELVVTIYRAEKPTDIVWGPNGPLTLAEFKAKGLAAPPEDPEP